MRDFIDNFITVIIGGLIIIILGLTIYFCLDVFGVITVPSKYSLASFFYTQVEVLAVGNDMTENNDITNEVRKPVNKVFRENTVSDVSADYAFQVLNEIDKQLAENEGRVPAKEEVTEIKTVSMNRYYYEQLDEYGQKIYDELHNNLDEIKKGDFSIEFGLEFNDLLNSENGSKVLNDSFQVAVNALTMDNPDLYYINITKICLETRTIKRAFSKTHEVTICSSEDGVLSAGFENQEYINNTRTTLEGIKGEIIKACKDKTTKDQIRIVHDYLVDTIEYDGDAGSNIYNIYGALVSRKSVCEGYARTFKYILDDLGIPCIIVCGVGTNTNGETEKHAWNYVYLNNNWYAVDVTWDDPIITGGKMNDTIKYAYFLKGSEEFFKDHVENGAIVEGANLVYPTISTSNY